MSEELYQHYDLRINVQEGKSFTQFFIENNLGKIVINSPQAEMVALAILQKMIKQGKLSGRVATALQALLTETDED